MVLMSAKALRVIIDNRERNAELIGAMREIGVEVEFRNLPVGDYILSDRLCIERKTVGDFESSIINGRLFDQIKRLKETYEFPVLLLEGDSDYFRFDRGVINGTMAALYTDYGIMVIRTCNPTESAEIMASMARHEQDGTAREPSLKGGARAYTREQFQEYVIGNIPGVGPKLARSLLVHFGSVRNIASAEIKELVKVEKIGKKKAELIRSTLNEMYRAEPDGNRKA